VSAAKTLETDELIDFKLGQNYPSAEHVCVVKESTFGFTYLLY